MPVVLDQPGIVVRLGSCLDELRELPDGSVHAVVTDPPYGFDPLDENGQERPLEASDWDQGDARRDLGPADRTAAEHDQYQQRRANSVRYNVDEERHTPDSWGVNKVVGGYAAEKGLIALPRYMLPPKALFNYQLWCAMWAAECLRVLVPGGHLVAFNGSKTYHRMAVGIEDAGFEIRDTLHWTYGKGQPTGTAPWQAIDRLMGHKRPKGDRSGPVSDLARMWKGWHTGLKPSHELAAIARKPFPGTVHQNVLAYGTGAFNVGETRVVADGSDHDRWPVNTILTHSPWCGLEAWECADGCPVALLEQQKPGASAYFTITRWDEPDFDALRYVNKPSTKERHGTLDPGQRNTHPTVKPVAVMEHLVRLVTPVGGVVLDPFAGSATTGLAAVRRGFQTVLIERDPAHLPIIAQRLGNAQLPLFTH